MRITPHASSVPRSEMPSLANAAFFRYRKKSRLREVCNALHPPLRTRSFALRSHRVWRMCRQSESLRRAVLRISALIVCLLILLALLLRIRPVCLRVCTLLGRTTVSACFNDGCGPPATQPPSPMRICRITRSVALDSLIFPRGECVYLCGLAIRHIGSCGCPNDCGAAHGRGQCARNTCVCAAGWGGRDCSLVHCPANNCSGHGKCVAGKGTPMASVRNKAY